MISFNNNQQQERETCVNSIFGSMLLTNIKTDTKQVQFNQYYNAHKNLRIARANLIKLQRNKYKRMVITKITLRQLTGRAAKFGRE